jgi:hypothetical protein
MVENNIRILERAKKHLKSSDISKENKAIIVSFIEHLSAEGFKIN